MGQSGTPRPDLSSGSPSENEDPIWQGEEPVEKATPRATLLFQFFLFPLMIVVAAVGVFLFFGAIGGTEKSPREYLDEVRGGGENVQKQAAHQLAVLLYKERMRVDEERSEGREGKAAFYMDPDFRAQLGKAFEDSFSADKTNERRLFLTSALGFVGDPAYLEPLKSHLSSDDPDLRRATVKATGELQTDDVVPILVSLLKDGDEPVRNYAVVGLSKHRSAASIAGLKSALTDESVYVQVNAAGALAVHGDASGIELLEKSLDPAWVEKTIAAGASGKPATAGGQLDTPAELRQATLANGIRGAFALKDGPERERLRASVEKLTKDSDDKIRWLAREELNRWKRDEPKSDR